jgi:hypothetical protein
MIETARSADITNLKLRSRQDESLRTLGITHVHHLAASCGGQGVRMIPQEITHGGTNAELSRNYHSSSYIFSP